MSHNEQLLLLSPPSDAAGSLRSPSGFFLIAQQQSCGRRTRRQSQAETLQMTAASWRVIVATESIEVLVCGRALLVSTGTAAAGLPLPTDWEAVPGKKVEQS